MRKLLKNIAPLIVLLAFSCQKTLPKVEQETISRIEMMPNHPEPYKMIDWREKALTFDQFAFNHEKNGPFTPVIWLDSSRRNVDQVTFGLYTALGDIRQGIDKYPEFHEAINSITAIMGAGLVGIDKTDQDGFNYVRMVQNYFNSDNGWNIVMNNTSEEVAQLGGGYGRDWWYDVYPNLLYYAMAAVFPEVENTDYILKNVAEQFFKADSVLNGRYDYSFFDYAAMEGKVNHIPTQEDAAAGHAYVLLCAYEKFGDPRYLKGAQSAMDALLDLNESRLYEILLPFGAYVGARLNAEHGTSYDIKKILDWTFEGCQAENGRTGWGIIAERWGDHDVHGTQGSITDGGGYAFLMNTFVTSWPLVPMVRYEPSYAKAIGKWMLNTANASRLFYPYEIEDSHQWLPEKKSITKNVIAYEGLRKKDFFGKEALKGISPVALGDGPVWLEGNPPESMFSVYSSAPVGIYGAMIKKTNVERILQINCLTTDFYRGEAFPTYLYYNPYQKEQSVVFYHENDGKVDLYDALRHKWVAKGIERESSFLIPAEEAALIVAIPENMELKIKEGVVYAGETIIAYQ